ncbi:hypothetical protein [Neisseria zalophi]|uniref:DUF4303 domain-containing protein n=1 Tax=Neisseria zalophi TaxID=640030 RepID=A0A5J6PXS8_9NEIS|nr:hypothetical protein [Neisseria zalophi]QEY26996.1 hypothetical protein D0T92_10945 [Neisseria zalophi]
MKIKEIIYNGVSNEIKKWNFDEIYVISLFIFFEYDDLRTPILILGFNTIKNWQESINLASNEQEAKWNYAFWLQNEEYQFGYSEDDKKVVETWIKELNLFYTDEEEDKYFDKCMELGEQISIVFTKLCVDVASEIQKNILPYLTNKKIPILVHELEYYDKIVEQNKIINPNGEANEFIKWIYSMWNHPI